MCTNFCGICNRHPIVLAILFFTVFKKNKQSISCKIKQKETKSNEVRVLVKNAKYLFRSEYTSIFSSDEEKKVLLKIEQKLSSTIQNIIFGKISKLTGFFQKIKKMSNWKTPSIDIVQRSFPIQVFFGLLLCESFRKASADSLKSNFRKH